ncbi:putative inactive caspase B [Clavelina lepadiformis]|uniref:putative inactive caspase B n=1 Tax=Clavelina lepadiformis TaxID=159417 RepID=UPI0040438F4E
MSNKPKVKVSGNVCDNSNIIAGAHGPVTIDQSKRSGVDINNSGKMTVGDVIAGNSRKRIIKQGAGSYYQEGSSRDVSIHNSAASGSSESRSTKQRKLSEDFKFLDGSYPGPDDIDVKPCTNPSYQKHFEDNDIYPVRHRGKSRALIINNINFENRIRNGANKDTTMVDRLLQQLGFQVDLNEDLCKEEIEEVVTNFIKDLSKHNDAAMSLVYIGSHGGQENNRDYFRSVDEEKIFMEDLCKKFMVCHEFAGKPKIFFLQFCRNSPQSRDSDEDGDCDGAYEFNTLKWLKNETEADDDSTALDKADVLLSFATAKGDKAYRDGNGSWYTAALCKVMMKYAKQKDLADMLCKVNEEVRQKNKTIVQVTQFESTLSKQVKFFPGSSHSP